MNKLTEIQWIEMGKEEDDDHQCKEEERHLYNNRMMNIVVLQRQRREERGIILYLTVQWERTNDSMQRQLTSGRGVKYIIIAYNSDDSEKDDDSKSKEGDKGIGLDIGVSVLIHLHQNYTTSDEHEGSICVRQILKYLASTVAQELASLAYQTENWHYLDKYGKRNS